VLATVLTNGERAKCRRRFLYVHNSRSILEACPLNRESAYQIQWRMFWSNETGMLYMDVKRAVEPLGIFNVE
jgi:hypothetical protein